MHKTASLHLKNNSVIIIAIQIENAIVFCAFVEGRRLKSTTITASAIYTANTGINSTRIAISTAFTSKSAILFPLCFESSSCSKV